MTTDKLHELTKLIRYDIITSTTAAGSGHPTTSLSAVELMTVLFFDGYLHYDLENPKYIFNDRIIFSKGHGSPLLYALYQAAGVLSHQELLDLRKFDSVLEGHPTPRFKYIDVATGSLGQGLSIGLGMALGIKMKNETAKLKRESKVFVLLGDSEFAEGQVWEALELAGYYKTNNLIGILDVNRLGQRGETMLGWDIETYKKRIESFGWETVMIQDGNNLEQVQQAFQKINVSKKPLMIIAKTIKGKGVSFLENKDNWHGKTLSKEDAEKARQEIGKVDLHLTGKIQMPEKINVTNEKKNISITVPKYENNKLVATREAYGEALIAIANQSDRLVVLDAETSNSTYAEKIKSTHPEKFFEMFIAEQNMASVALGFDKIGYEPFISTFAAFLTRAFDQMRMSQYSDGNVNIVGSHAGVSIGSDGSSQMALEDLAMMRSILHSIVLYPSDAISTIKLCELMFNHQGLTYLRLTREKTPLLYSPTEIFIIGGSKVLFENKEDTSVVISCGVTLHETIKAYHDLQKQDTHICVIDAYSVKPLDEETIKHHAQRTGKVIVVEDHYPYGGLGEAVKTALSGLNIPVIHLAVHNIPRSGTPQELLAYEEIDAEAVKKAVLR